MYIEFMLKALFISMLFVSLLGACGSNGLSPEELDVKVGSSVSATLTALPTAQAATPTADMNSSIFVGRTVTARAPTPVAKGTVTTVDEYLERLRLLSAPTATFTPRPTAAYRPTPTPSAYAYFLKGKAHYDLGEYAEAIEDFNEASRLNEPVLYISYFRGRSYQNLGLPAKAIQNYHAAIRLNPTDNLAYFHRGNAYRSLGLYQESIEDYTKAIELNPRGDASDNIRAMYSQLVLEEADEDYAESAKLDSAGSIAYYNRGNSYYQLGLYEKAIEDYTRAIGLDPTYAVAYYNRGLTHDDLGQSNEAERDFEVSQKLTAVAQKEAAALQGEASPTPEPSRVGSIPTPDERFFRAGVNPCRVYVNGYTRSDGTRVNGHWRTCPNSSTADNAGPR